MGVSNLLLDPGAISTNYASADSDYYLLACNAAVRNDLSFLIAWEGRGLLAMASGA